MITNTVFEARNPDWSTLIKSGVMVMVFNASFNNISVVSWQSVLLVEVTRIPRENHQPAASD